MTLVLRAFAPSHLRRRWHNMKNFFFCVKRLSCRAKVVSLPRETNQLKTFNLWN